MKVYVVMCVEGFDRRYIGRIFANREAAEKYIEIGKPLNSRTRLEIQEHTLWKECTVQTLMSPYYYIPTTRQEYKNNLINIKFLNDKEEWLIAEKLVVEKLTEAVLKIFPYKAYDAKCS